MQETIAQISNQVTEKWESFTKKQKVQIGIGVLLVIVAIGAIAFLSRTQMRTLFAGDIDPKATAEVTAVLSENKIAYNLINDGGNVEVDSKQYGKARMVLSQEGVPNTSYTFTDAITNTMSTTEDEKKEKMNYLKKEELQNTLKLVDGVEDARIELVIPEEKNSFLQAQQQSKASVFLTLSRAISTKQAEGIARMVAASVQNLDMKNVNIMDAEGTTLYTGSDESSIDMTKQQELKQSAEKLITDKVNNLLSAIYDDVRVSPNLILDFDQYEEINEEYKTQGEDESRGVVQQESVANSSSTNTAAGGQPGTPTNGGTNYAAEEDGTEGTSKSSEKDIVYSPDKKVSTSVKNVGDINFDKASLAVNVFKNKVYREEEIAPTLVGTTWAEFKLQNKDQVSITIDDSIIASIQNATGIEKVAVYGYENPIFLDTPAYVINYKDYLPFVLILLILIVVAIAIMKFRKHEEIIEVEPELEVEEMLKTAKEQVSLEKIELKETLETKRQIDKFVDEKPEAVANLLRNWLTEDEWE